MYICIMIKHLIKDLFTFPIVMVDGENEERKEREMERDSNLVPNQEPIEIEYDIVEGVAEYPYYDFVGIEDRWLPTKKSLRRAMRQKFDACIVRFDNVGQFLVPLTKEEFKERFRVFSEQREQEKEKERQEYGTQTDN